ncbi:MAG: ribosome silencing factor [Alphaproteobacteria bacterium]
MKGATVAHECTVIAARRKARPRTDAERTLALVNASLEDDKAIDLHVIPLAGKAQFADYMVVASGTSNRHLATMADHLLKRLKEETPGATSKSEGRGTSDWVLIDAGDVVVHLFRPEARDHYDIEKLWEAELEVPATG